MVPNESEYEKKTNEDPLANELRPAYESFRCKEFDELPVKLLSYKGRLLRRDFVPIYITYFLCLGIRQAFLHLDRNHITEYFLGAVIIIICFAIMLPICVKRLHDTGRSAWYMLMAIIPFVNFYWLYLVFKAGDVTFNDYGPPNPIKKYNNKSIIAVCMTLISLSVFSFMIPYLNLPNLGFAYYDNNYKKDTVFNAYGEFKNGDTYIGEWKNGLMCGEGTYRTADETVFTGIWEDGDLDDTAEITWANGDTYSGEVENRLMDGNGTYTYADGTVQSGTFREGVYIGE